MHFREIPETIEDYNKKRRSWPGFKYALRKIGLNSKDVANRGRPPWRDYEEQREKCARAHLKFQRQQKEVKLKSRIDTSTRAPKSKPQRKRQDEDSEVEREPINTYRGKKSNVENKIWKEGLKILHQRSMRTR